MKRVYEHSKSYLSLESPWQSSVMTTTKNHYWILLLHVIADLMLMVCLCSFIITAPLQREAAKIYFG